MSSRSQTSSRGTPTVDPAEDAYGAATAALLDMRQWRLDPTPNTYELFLAYRSNTNFALRQRLDQLIRSGSALTNSLVETLYEEFIGPVPSTRLGEVERQLGWSKSLGDAAAELVSHAATSRAAIRSFGDALRNGAEQLDRNEDADERLRVIAVLANETCRATDRNRALEQQLAATTLQVEMLRESLAAHRQAACTDELTGLSNRRLFDERLRNAIARAASGADGVFSVLLLDVDHFKRFNDAHGHNAGDLVLRLLGRLLIESIKGRDLAARYGGEEFTVLLMGANLAAATNVAVQINRALGAKRVKLSSDLEQGKGRITVSIGVAQYRLDDTAASLLERADQAMYAAKRGGRNRVVTEPEVAATTA